MYVQLSIVKFSVTRLGIVSTLLMGAIFYRFKLPNNLVAIFLIAPNSPKKGEKILNVFLQNTHIT
jgi:hypothetical protein